MASHALLTYLSSEMLPTMLNQLYSVQQYKSKLFKLAPTMKIMDDFRQELKPSCVYYKTDTFRGEQRSMGHKGGHGKSMKNALYVQWHGKRHFLG